MNEEETELTRERKTSKQQLHEISNKCGTLTDATSDHPP